MNRFLTALLIAAICPLAAADNVELKNGDRFEGFWLEDTSTHIIFQVRGETKPRKFKHKEIEELALTFPPEEERIAADPNWSVEREERAIAEYFLPEEAEDIDVVRSKHYIIFSTAPGADRMVKAMEKIYTAFVKTFSFEEPEGAPLLPVYLLKDHGQYTEWSMRSTGWTREQAARSAGHAYREYFATYFTGGADATMYHEAAHQLVGNRLMLNGGGSWFQEGMAVYFEDKWMKSKRLGNVASGMIKSDNYTHFRELFDVKSLLHSDGDSQRGSVAGQRYTQSGTIIHFLVEGKLKKNFVKMLSELRVYRPSNVHGDTAVEEHMWDTIFRKAYGLNIDEVEELWKEHF
ncbi:MAG: hypothetical protein ACI8X5_000736 [Planctomycetota bacterium]|jgi:hypothetical protein